MKGWKTRSPRKSFSITGHGYGREQCVGSDVCYGEKDYFLGGYPIWELFRVGFRMLKARLLRRIGPAFRLWLGRITRLQRPISMELMGFHSREQMKKLANSRFDR